MGRLLTLLVLASCCASSGRAWQHPKAQRNVEDTIIKPTQPATIGPYYALVIGNANYKYIKPLKTPINDAEAVARMLREKYGFHTKVLHDATRGDILAALFEYRRTLPENSNLLLYYAGHGDRDPVTHVAYWFPVDAQLDNNANWISASDISADISAIASAHILIISDSCYSGELSLSRDAGMHIEPTARDAFLAKMLQHKSRTLLASGGNEPVWDGGAAGHSIFAAVLLRTLQEMDQDRFNASDIFVTIQHRVAGQSQQLPQYSSINNSGHDGGDFVFSRSGGGLIADVEPDRGGVRETLPSDQEEEIASLMSRYQGAFEAKDIGALVRLWPAMPGPTRKANTQFFEHASGVKMTYTMLGKPVIGTDVATVKFSQELDFVANGQPQRVVSPQVTMMLTRAAEQRGTASWQISGVR